MPLRVSLARQTPAPTALVTEKRRVLVKLSEAIWLKVQVRVPVASAAGPLSGVGVVPDARPTYFRSAGRV